MSEEEKQYQLVEVPTGSELAFQTPSGKVLSQEGLLIEIANELKDIKKALA